MVDDIHIAKVFPVLIFICFILLILHRLVCVNEVHMCARTETGGNSCADKSLTSYRVLHRNVYWYHLIFTTEPVCPTHHFQM